MKREISKVKKTNELIGESIENYGPDKIRKRPVEGKGGMKWATYDMKKMFGVE